MNEEKVEEKKGAAKRENTEKGSEEWEEETEGVSGEGEEGN